MTVIHILIYHTETVSADNAKSPITNLKDCYIQDKISLHFLAEFTGAIVTQEESGSVLLDPVTMKI
jgi:hypothetical protein